MKTILSQYNFYLLLLLIGGMSMGAYAGEPKVKVSKNWSKSLNVNSNERITLINQFGDMQIIPWNKNEVKVEVTISAEAATEAKAREIIDRITIEDSRRDGGPYFKTKFAKEKDNWSKGEKQGFQINYVAYVPAKNPLVASNEFGAINVGDLDGEATLTSKFGMLTTGKLSNVKKVQVEFGKVNIGSISNGRLEVKFSKASIDNLTGDVKCDFEYCDVAKLKVDNDAKGVTVNNKFSTLYLDCNTNLSANFNISTSFGDVSNKTNFQITEEGKDDNRRGPHFDKKFSGKSGGGTTDVNIRAEYGKVILGHNLNVNMDKKKHENRNENRNESRADERSERRERKRVTTI